VRKFFHFSAFLLIPALSAVTPLIAIPAITATSGAGGWEAYALGLSIGSAACTLVELGWPLTGPQRVAAEVPGDRWVSLVSSIRTRLLALIVLAPLATGLAVLLAWNATPEHVATTSLMALASAASGLSGNWYFIGVGRPLRILTSDALPRAVLVAAASLAVLGGAPLEVVPLGYIAAVAISPIASLLLARTSVRRRAHPRRRHPSHPLPAVSGWQSVRRGALQCAPDHAGGNLRSRFVGGVRRR
jgi:O-antigen/teichoic acid export membrane protein